MTTGGGYGSIPYGSGPYGGGLVEVAGEDFDVFCLRDLDMYQALSNPDVDYTPVDAQYYTPNPSTLDLELCSGGSKDPLNARLWVTQSVGDTFTAEWIVKFNNLPNDFTDLTNSHIYLAATDAAGALAGFFFSAVGVAYTGSVSYSGGTELQLDCTFQQLPDSSSYINDTDYWVIRAAVSYNLGIVYFYMTKLSDVAVTGHQLRAILPVIPYTAAANPPTDQVIASVRGTASIPSCAFLDSMCLGTSLIIPNLAPEANAGLDQAVRLCSIAQLDGSASFDPEGASLGYQWRLVEGPSDSEFVEQLYDGTTAYSPSGFVDRFYSQELGAVDAIDPLVPGDVINVRSVAYSIVGTGLDGGNFYVQVGSEILPDEMSSEPFKFLRQRGISNPTTVNPTFYPSVPGFYSFDLTVHDGQLSSSASLTIVNVLESPLPRGCTPDLTFMFNYLSDFWNLVEDRDRIAVFWSAVAQTVATELFTLWQYEYSKSLRDIQRTFVRRWLHYDLLLPEPLPELTRIRALYGGVESSAFSTAVVQGDVLHVVSDALSGGEYRYEMTPVGSVTPQELAADLQNKLQGFADPRFTVQTLSQSVGDSWVRIEAPFPFTLGADTTSSLFVVGDDNRAPSGTSGAAIGARTYKVEVTLEGLDLQEDDFLSIDGIAYRISSVLDNPADAYRYQRLVIKEDLRPSPGAEWSLSGWVSSELLDFYSGLVTKGDYVDFESSEQPTGEADADSTFEIVTCEVLGVSPVLVGRAAIDVWPLGSRPVDPDLQVLLVRALRRTYAPVSSLVVDVPTLQELIIIEDDEATLRRNVDYFLEEVRGSKALRFSSGRTADLGDVWEGERPPNRLWAEYTYINNNPLIEANFGLAAGLTEEMLAELPTGVDYLSAVRGLWYAFYNGPTMKNLRIGIQILLGLPFAEERGTIEEIRTDFSSTQGRILIRDVDRPEIVRSYNYPKVLDIEDNPATGATYVAGDTVEQFAPLIEGAEVVDYIKDPEWFEGLINQGIFYEVEKFHRFLVRVEEAAFDLDALLFARDFVLTAKPTYTFPLFFVRLTVDETEVSITDNIQFRPKLYLDDGPCEYLLGTSWVWDQPRPAGGGWRNQYDGDATPPSPTSPPPDSPIQWGYDKMYLCPQDNVTAIWCEQISGAFTPFFDGPFAYDTPVAEIIQFSDASPASIPAGPSGFDMTNVGDAAVDATGTLTQLRFLALGDPGTDPTDYEVVVENVTAATEEVEAFTAIVNTEIVRTLSLAVTASDVVNVRVRPATGGARAPNWSLIKAYVTAADGAMWTYDDTTLGDGVYCLERTL